MNPETKGASDSQTWETVRAMVIKRVVRDEQLIIAQSGDKAVAAFAGEPYAYEAVWEASNGWCAYDIRNTLHRDVTPALRIMINVVVVSENNIIANNRVAFFEMGPHVFRDLLRVREKYGLDGWLYEIERLDNDDAEAHYTILPDRKIDDHLANQLACTPRISLSSLVNARRRQDGIPGQRDPEFPCADFKPGTPSYSRCEGDGHYLCGECAEHSTRLTAEAVDSGSSDSAPVDGDGEQG